MVQQLLKGATIADLNNDSFIREIYIALNDRVLDYASYGNRQGYPFDPYLLYYQRRIRKAYQIMNELMTQVIPANRIPKVLKNYIHLLRMYLNDKQITQAEELYEKAYEIFERLRSALCLKSKGKSPLFEQYTINITENKQLKNNIEELLHQFKQEIILSKDEKEKKLYTIMINCIEKYKEMKKKDFVNKKKSFFVCQ